MIRNLIGHMLQGVICERIHTSTTMLCLCSNSSVGPCLSNFWLHLSEVGQPDCAESPDTLQAMFEKRQYLKALSTGMLAESCQVNIRTCFDHPTRSDCTCFRRSGRSNCPTRKKQMSSIDFVRSRRPRELASKMFWSYSGSLA
jgi:hypothetical protein